MTLHASTGTRTRARFIALMLALGSLGIGQGQAADCTNGLMTGRTIEIDGSSGPVYGEITRQTREPAFLRPREVVLTFDDGPSPHITSSILKTLDDFCVKATFFSVGRMAAAYPAMLKEVLNRGHTVGTHTMTHPYNLPRMKLEKAEDEIEAGFATVATAAGAPIAPFFRFPGLADSGMLVAHLKSRGIATFSVDVVSNDSYISSKARLVKYTLDQIERREGGIVLFHDIKSTTAKALPEILARLQQLGYKVVHLTAKTPVQPLPEMMEIAAARAAKTGQKKTTMVPFYGAAGLQKPDADASSTPSKVSTVQKRRAKKPAPAKKRNNHDAGADDFILPFFSTPANAGE
jgi:peptidoglycan/xylan/chitin deacetylase (PgdA/CDA1 family)